MQSHQDANTTQTLQPKPNERLELYNSLFGQGRNKICQNTGLPLVSSLNYSLQTFLYTCDLHWVLAMIEIDELENITNKLGHYRAKRKMIQVGTVIKNFCENDSRRLKGFKCNDSSDDESSVFAVLMYCYPKLLKSEKYMAKLMKKIKQQTNETVSVGIAKMNKWETFEQWKERSVNNIENARNGKNTQTQNENVVDAFYSDIHVQYVNPTKHMAVEDEKKQQRQAKLGGRKEFDKKMQEIANNEDYQWMIAIMEIDDFDLLLVSLNNDKKTLILEIGKLEKEMFHLFDIYGNSNGNKMKYFGYSLNDNTGRFGIILYDSRDSNECLVPAHEIIETLKEEISIKCQFTVCIGCSRLIEDDLGMADDWFDRINDNLKHAQKNGENQVCFGNGNKNHVDDQVGRVADNHDVQESKLDQLNSLNIEADDQILKKSLQAIEVRNI